MKLSENNNLNMLIIFTKFQKDWSNTVALWAERAKKGTAEKLKSYMVQALASMPIFMENSFGILEASLLTLITTDSLFLQMHYHLYCNWGSHHCSRFKKQKQTAAAQHGFAIPVKTCQEYRL